MRENCIREIARVLRARGGDVQMGIWEIGDALPVATCIRRRARIAARSRAAACPRAVISSRAIRPVGMAPLPAMHQSGAGRSTAGARSDRQRAAVCPIVFD
jgi:hypothetical protein